MIQSSRMIIKGVAALAIITVGASLLLATPANATTPSNASGTLVAVSRVAGLSNAVTNAAVTAPQASGQGVRLHGTEPGASLTITPRLHGSAAAHTQSGRTVLTDSGSALSIAVQPDPSGVTLMSILTGPSSPTSTSYNVTLPAGETLYADDLGGVMVLKNGVPVGRFNAPWAVDAANRSLTTSYSLSGNTITQTVNTSGAQFPVVADPKYTWGWISGTVYFNKHETATLALGAGIAAGLFAFLAPPFNWVLAASASIIAFFAGQDVIDNRCLSVSTFLSIGHYSGSSDGGYCR